MMPGEIDLIGRHNAAIAALVAASERITDKHSVGVMQEEVNKYRDKIKEIQGGIKTITILPDHISTGN